MPRRGGVSGGRPPIACGIRSPTCMLSDRTRQRNADWIALETRLISDLCRRIVAPGRQRGQSLPSASPQDSFSAPVVFADINIRTALSRSLGVDRRRLLRREIPNRNATLRIASGDRLMRFPISSTDFEEAANSSTRRSCSKDQRPPFSFRTIYDFPTFAFSPSSTSRRSVGQP
jgi:hypothetical protein